MEGLHCEPCQIRGVKTKAHTAAQALEEHTIPSETLSNISNKITGQGPGPVHSSEVVAEDNVLFSDPLLGLILKMPASLKPLCCGGSPILLPVEVAGGVEPQTTATPVITPPPSCLTVPPIFDQLHLQYLNPLSSCPITEHTQNLPHSLQQNNRLSQNPSLPTSPSQSGEGKSENSSMYSSDFLAALQALIPFLRNYNQASCQGSNSFPINDFGTGFIPPDSSMSHLSTGSPLVSLLPPATLLVPFPFVVPLPVPLPIPIPIPPFPNSVFFSRASHTMKTSKSTQTEDIPVCTYNRMSGYDFLQLPTQPPPPVSQEEVLDLTIKVVPIQTKQEVQFHRDHVLDLSVANKSCLDTNLKHCGRASTNEESSKLILPVKRSPIQTNSQSNGYSDVEFSMQYKWTTEEQYAKYALKYSDQNGRVMTPKHIPRVTQSTKGTSAMFCEQLVRPPQGQILKNKTVKQKRVNSQNINPPPIKKQHLRTIHPSK